MLIPRKLCRAFATLMCVALAITACARDPKVRKQNYMDSGKQYYEAGKYREASIQFSNALQIDPKDADLHYELAKTLFKLESWNNAYRELGRAIDLNPDNLPAQLDMGNLLLAGQNVSGAKEKAELVLAKDPNNVAAHTLLSNVYMAEKKATEASAELNKAIVLAP